VKQKRVLTGVKPTHIPHLGNYVGAIRPSIELSREFPESFLFIADHHALTSVQDPKLLHEYSLQVTACWLACGLDTQKTVIYRQSDVPEIFELSWMLSCVTPKGLMNRAHAYKAKLQDNQDQGREDLDQGVNMGLYGYPVLMSADILMFNATHVPVGEDQVQHIEIARDIAEKFNRVFGTQINLPAPVVQKNKLVPGLDGRKMSKSYGNHIPLFLESKALRKLVMKIVTDSTPPEAPKETKDSIPFQLYQEFATPAEVEALSERYKKGIGWGEAKEFLYQAIDRTFSEKTRLYNELVSDTARMQSILNEGAQRARAIAAPFLKELKKASLG
jgi:tryptophanyl-tRNA synthetase